MQQIKHSSGGLVEHDDDRDKPVSRVDKASEGLDQLIRPRPVKSGCRLTVVRFSKQTLVGYVKLGSAVWCSRTPILMMDRFCNPHSVSSLL